MAGQMMRWMQHGACLGLVMLVAIVCSRGHATTEVLTAAPAPHERLTETTPDQLAAAPMQPPTIPESRQ